MEEEDWEELMPDSGDYGITVGEAVKDVAAFFAQVLGVLLLVALVLAATAYSLWREYTIMSWFVGN